MKILYVIKYLSPIAGGPVTSLLPITNALVKLGHEVTILTTDYRFDEKFSKRFQNVEIIPVHCLFRVGGLLYSPEIHSWLSEHIFNFDVVHLQDYRTYQNAITGRYAYFHNIPYIIQAHGSAMPFFEKKALKIMYDLIYGNKLLERSSMVLALTELEVSQYIIMGVSEEKIKTISNGIDPADHRKLPEEGLFRKQYLIPKENKIVLFLGRVHKIKGIDLLIDAFSDLHNVVNNVTLVIVGPDGGCQHELLEKVIKLEISDNVIFTGPLYDQEKVSAYIDADVYVLPSVYETFPMTVLEAWTFGTPVIISETCGLSTKIAMEQAGIVVKRDSIEISHVMQRLFVDEKLREMISANGRNLVEGEYNHDRIIKKLEEIYVKLNVAL